MKEGKREMKKIGCRSDLTWSKKDATLKCRRRKRGKPILTPEGKKQGVRTAEGWGPRSKKKEIKTSARTTKKVKDMKRVHALSHGPELEKRQKKKES